MTNKRKQIQQAYDAIADEYHNETDKNDDGMNKSVLKKFQDKLQQNALILDAGCGGKPFRTPRTTTIGIDISGEQLKQHTENTALLAQGDMTKLPFKDNTFYGATAFYSLIHIPLDKHQTVIDELSRVLKPGSPLLLVEGTEEWVGSNESWLNSGQEMHWEMAGEEATRNQIQNADFTIKTVQPVEDTLGDADGTKLFFLAQKN